MSCCLSRWQEGEHRGWASLVFVSEGVWVEVRCATLQPGGIYSKLGGHLQWYGGIPWRSCGAYQVVVPSDHSSWCCLVWCWWHSLSCYWVQTSLQGGIMCGCIMAGFGAPGSHPPYTNSGDSPPMGNNKVQRSTTPETPPRRNPDSTAVGLFPGLDPYRKAQSWHQSQQPVLALAWVSPEQNVSLGKLIVSLLPQGTATLPGADHRATCCQGSSVFHLGSQLSAACQAEGELGTAYYLKAPCDGCGDGRRLVSLIRGEGRKGGVASLPGDERVAETEVCASAGWLGTVPREPHPSGQGYFKLQTKSALPWE